MCNMHFYVRVEILIMMTQKSCLLVRLLTFGGTYCQARSKQRTPSDYYLLTKSSGIQILLVISNINCYRHYSTIHTTPVPCLICPVPSVDGHHHQWKLQWARPSTGDQVDPLHSLTTWYAPLLRPHILGRSRVLHT
jgi:hypothetical protein